MQRYLYTFRPSGAIGRWNYFGKMSIDATQQQQILRKKAALDEYYTEDQVFAETFAIQCKTQ
ncbi:MAG: hypothetical protein OXP71_16755 [Candidatus Poribacteria bacterium]|nr:hypothetical protein [Candidatus Poribacteria bacterium]